jgi:hypothetical protein
MRKCFQKNCLTVLLISVVGILHAQKADSLLAKVRQKLLLVKDYQADAMMKLNVPFLQVPDSKVTIYFKQPDKFKIVQNKGVSIIPRGGVSINLPAMLEEKQSIAVDAGSAVINKESLRIIKLLPVNEAGDVILSTLYVDPKTFLVKRIISTTKENGTHSIDFIYGKYISWALPDELMLSFDTKNYKLPKGMTFDYEDEVKPDTTKTKNGRGEVKIVFEKYVINKGVSDSYFQQK